MSRLARSRARHFLFLVPLGGLVGTATGAAFRDTLFGLAVGVALGALLAVVVTLRVR